MATMKSGSRNQLESHYQIDTPESRYYTPENTPDMRRDNRPEQRYCPEQQEVTADNMGAVFKKEQRVRTAELGFRLSEMVLCLVSFSVMATDRTQGWAGDSFDRYKEYRYCLSVNVIGCVYSGFQACDMAYQLVYAKKNRILRHTHNLRSLFDYLIDQIMAYMLISASSSAATRVCDWESNWGKDKFTEKASASIGMAFLAFIGFAFSSIISYYKLCIRTTFPN